MILANSWSPVMLQQWFMLLFGNLIIGTIEGAVIAKVFRASFLRTISLLILANYASMWAGAILFGIGESPGLLPENLFESPLREVRWLIWVGIVVAFALSIVIEWPFCFAALPAGNARLKRSILATLLAQISSYCCIGLTHFRSTNTIGRDVHVAKASDIDRSLLNGSVYFINPDDGDVYSMRLDSSGLQRHFDANLMGFRDVLAITGEEDAETPPWKLIGAMQVRREKNVLMESLPGHVEPFRMNPYKDDNWIVSDGWQMGFCGIADHRPTDQRDWQATPQGNNGLNLSNIQTGESFDVTYDTMFTSWWGRCVTILPGDFVVFELGQQVCLLDIESRRIAILIRGRGPVVVMDESAKSSIAQD